MKDDFEDIDNLFRDALSESNEAPSGKAWSAVEVSLDRKSVADLSKKYNKLKRLVALLLLLLTVSISYEIYHLNQSHQSLKDNKQEGSISAANPKDNTTGNVSQGNTNNVLSPGKASANDPDHLNNTSSSDNEAIVIKRARPKQSIFLRSSRTHREKISVLNGSQVADASDFNTDQPFLKVRNTTVALHEKTNEASTSAFDNNRDGVYSYSAADVPIINAKLNQGNTAALAINATKLAPALLENKSSKAPVASKLSKGSHLLQRISINPFYAPDIDIYQVKDGGHRNGGGDFHNDEDRKYSYTTGVNINVSLNKHLSLRSGLAYSSTSLHVSSRDIYAMQDNNGDTTFRFDGSCGSGNFHPPHGAGQSANIGDSLQVTDANNSLGYLRVPLALQYSLAKGRFIFDAFAGAAISFLIKGSLTATVGSGTAKELQTVSSVDGLKKTTYTALMGLGTEYVLNRRINLTFSPLATLALTPINTSASAVQTYPNTLSFAAGIKIKL